MPVTRPLVAFLTDFGLSDTFVGVMKGIILEQVPDANLVDLSHSIPPQDVRSAAYHLSSSYLDLAEGTLFVAVVDPGVGTERKILYAESAGRRFLAPDNGSLSWVFSESPPTRLIAVNRNASPRSTISPTFHGRDIFAPVAARLLKGERPDGLGERIDDWVKIPFPLVTKAGTLWMGQIISVDAFGNLVTNFRTDQLAPLATTAKLWFEVGEAKASVRGLAASYASVETGKPLAIAGSAGYIEISVRDGNASQTFKLKTGDPIVVHLRV